MQTFRYDYNSSLEENIKVITNGTEEILFSFEVVPLDTYVDDISSPTIIFTQNLVIFRYDHIIEASLLSETDIYMMGDEPQFRVFWQLFEPTYFYDRNSPETVYNIKNNEAQTRIYLHAKGQIPKSFVIRDKTKVCKNYQNWASYQKMINHKSGLAQDIKVDEMINGNLSKVNNKTVRIFLIVFFAFVAIKIILSLGLPDIIGTILDFVFGGILIAMGVWTYLSMEQNNKRYYNVFLQYKQPKIINSRQNPEQVNNNIIVTSKETLK